MEPAADTLEESSSLSDKISDDHLVEVLLLALTFVQLKTLNSVNSACRMSVFDRPADQNRTSSAQTSSKAEVLTD